MVVTMIALLIAAAQGSKSARNRLCAMYAQASDSQITEFWEVAKLVTEPTAAQIVADIGDAYCVTGMFEVEFAREDLLGQGGFSVN